MTEAWVVVMHRNGDAPLGCEVFGPFDSEDRALDWLEGFEKHLTDGEIESTNFAVIDLVAPFCIAESGDGEVEVESYSGALKKLRTMQSDM